MQENLPVAEGEESPHFLSINLADYKKLFNGAIIPLGMAIVACFLLVKVSSLDFSALVIQRLALPIMAGLAILSFVHSALQKHKLKKVQAIGDFDEKAEAYQRVYRFRLLWFVISGLTCCFLFLFSRHNLFLYFALFDTLLLWSNYPNQQIFKRELENEDIIFY